MAYVTVQIGQCGNTFGEELFCQLHGAFARGGPRLPGDSGRRQQREGRFFRRAAGGAGEPVARCVLVDTEPKVVQGLLRPRRRRGWAYDARSGVFERAGSGNNWAVGYGSQAPALRDGIEEALRREAERCDRLEGFHLLHSCAGGTGSGLGSYLTPMVRDIFPAKAVANTVVLPYDTGEVIVQNYNALLTLAALQQDSDAVLLLENQLALSLLGRQLQVDRPSLRQLNRVLATPVAAALTPGEADGGADGGLRGLAEHLCCSPSRKLLSTWSAPQTLDSSAAFTRSTWDGLLSRLGGMLWQCRPLEMDARRSGAARNAVLACQLALHGDGAAAAALGEAWGARRFRRAGGLRTVRSEGAVGGLDRTATCVSNCRRAGEVAARVVDKSESMLLSRAYLHQYEAHGVEAQHFADSFMEVQQVVASYAA